MVIRSFPPLENTHQSVTACMLCDHAIDSFDYNGFYWRRVCGRGKIVR